jgi:hypothetical protein
VFPVRYGLNSYISVCPIMLSVYHMRQRERSGAMSINKLAPHTKFANKAVRVWNWENSNEIIF